MFKSSNKMFQIPIRWIISLLGMYSMALLFAERAALSITLVAMTTASTTRAQPEPYIGVHYCANNASSQQPESFVEQLFNVSNSDSLAAKAEFDWNDTLQGFILGSSFYLYLIIPAFAGRLTDSFGGKWVIFTGVLGPCLLTTLLPVAIRTLGIGAFITLQTLIGGFHGTLQASLFSLNTKWFPATERPITNAGILFGSAFGNACMSIAAGYLCQTQIGWPLVFYVLTAIHLPWLALWAYFCSSNPNESKRVSDKELAYIQMNVHQKNGKNTIKAPWRSIATSIPVWCSILTKCATSFGYFLLLGKVPSFLASIFGVAITQNGTFTAAVTSSTSISSLAAPALANWIIRKFPSIRPILVRKAFQTGAMLGPAACLVLLTFLECQLTAAFCLIFSALFCYGLMTGGEYSIVSDFAPNLAGTVMGVVVILPFSMGFVGPYLVGVVLDHETGTLNDRWNNIFFITAGIYLAGLAVFLIFGTDKQQEWDKLVAAQNDAQKDRDYDDNKS